MRMSRTFRVGTRASRLALTQTQAVLQELSRVRPDVAFELLELKTEGDRNQHVPLPNWGRGVFVKEIERALLAGQVDLAVHSLKDVPADETPGLAIAGIPVREDPQEVLVGRSPLQLEELPSGARIGTSSLRRAAFLRAFRPDFRIIPLRGNVDTRVRRVLQDQDLGGIVLAAAGLHRLGLDDAITQFLPYDVCLPAPGQGALAIQVRAGDEEAIDVVFAIHDPHTGAAVRAERELLRLLGGGCQVPIAAIGEVGPDHRLCVQAAVAAPDGSRVAAARASGAWDAPEDIAATLADRLRLSGADEILAQVRALEAAR